jgi:hypothetical protein
MFYRNIFLQRVFEERRSLQLQRAGLHLLTTGCMFSSSALVQPMPTIQILLPGAFLTMLMGKSLRCLWCEEAPSIPFLRLRDQPILFTSRTRSLVGVFWRITLKKTCLLATKLLLVRNIALTIDREACISTRKTGSPFRVASSFHANSHLTDPLLRQW